MDVQTFGAAVDAAFALHALHVSLTCIAMLMFTTTRPLAADVAIFLASRPLVTVLGLMICSQKRLLVILLNREAYGTGLAPNGLARGAFGKTLLVLFRLLHATFQARPLHRLCHHILSEELVPGLSKLQISN